MKRTLARAVVCVSVCACSAPDHETTTATTRAALASAPLENFYVVLDGPAAIETVPRGVPLGSKAGVTAVQRRMAEQGTQRAAVIPELEREGAVVIADIKRLGNLLQVLAPTSALDAIARIPGVTRVEPVPYFEPSLTSAVPVVGAPGLWQNTTPFDGDGITIGIIDSGIDYTHADFAGPGTKAAYEANDPKLIEPGSFPTAKVVGGHDFVGNDYFPGGGNETPAPDPDPLDCLKPQSMQVAGGHGTHVAGIAAGTGVTLDDKTFNGPYTQSLNPAQFRIGPGVAPRAKLYALKIFGCQGGTQMLGPALERAVDPNEDGDLSDRLDVVNASLGTSYALSTVSQEYLVDNLALAGTVFVAAAGNEGDAFFATGAPGSYRGALSVAASADSQLISLEVTAPASAAGKIPAAEGGFTTRLVDSGPISGSVVYAQPNNACATLSNAGAIAGKILLVDRGDCSFVSKFNRAVSAGAIAVIVADDEDQAVPFAMGGGDPGEVPIPGVMINKSDGTKLKAAIDQGLDVSMDGTDLFQGPGSELLAGFSSRGPSAQDERMKPEIAAPGFAIDSARVGSGSAPRRSQGTSMASPMVAGAAALVRQAQPNLSSLEVKSALVISAAALSNFESKPYPASLAGSGRLAVDRAAGLDVTAHVDEHGTVGMSYGLIKATSSAVSETRSFNLKNHGSETIEYDLEPVFAAELAGVTASVQPSELTLGPGAEATVTLTLNVDPASLPAAAPDPATPLLQYEQPRHFLTEASGHVHFASSAHPDQSLAVPYYAAVRRDLERAAKPLGQCPSVDSDGTLTIELEGETGNVTPATSVFRLGTTHPKNPLSDTDQRRAQLDVRAVGIATDLAAKGNDFEEASLFVAVAIEGEWTTPAQGVWSIPNVYLDVDGDLGADYTIRTEAFTRDGPYLDVLTATTYDLSSQQPTPSKRFLNMLPSTTINTQPFHNSVVVMPVFLRDIGIDETNPVVSYIAYTQPTNIFEPGEQTDWQSFDVTKPGVDSSSAGLEGRPIFDGDELSVKLVADSPDAALPQLLLLHHTNAAGKRWEVVDLVDPNTPTGNVAIGASAPDTAEVGERVVFTLTTTNQQSSADAPVKLTGSLSGATIDELPASCTASGASNFSCDLGSLSAGDATTLEIAAIVSAAAGGQASIEVTAEVEIACETTPADNSASAALSVTGGDDPTPGTDSGRDPAGGCACRIGSERESQRGALLALGLLLALGFRRRTARA